ncbi:MAG: DUF1015 domain-containing protein [Bacteroidetes bacterium]|nr:MAG: DUF1015 domain-containing protein [Bacteroidota bacterium]
MAKIRPFRAWRYNLQDGSVIEEYTSPLFDVASERQIETLRQNKLNSIHLTLPSGPNPSQRAKDTLARWKQDKVIIQDAEPAIYVYYQYFNLHNENKIHCRKGIIAMVKYPNDEDAAVDQILIHESTIKEAVESRKELLMETEICTSPTHGLYNDPTNELESLMDKSMNTPLYDVTDYQGVRDVISVIKDDDGIKKIVALIAKKQIALADGHHRYQAGLDYRNEQESPSGACNYHLMYLTNSHADDFRILATHRLIHKIVISEAEFITRARAYFDIIDNVNPYDANDVILGKKWTFGAIFKDNAYQLSLKKEMTKNFNSEIHEAVRSLDVVIAHTFIIEKILALPVPSRLTTEEVSFESNFSECLAMVDHEKAKMAIILNEISPEEVFKVGEKGAIMPQKTTFFHPKVVGGYLFGTIKDDEFDPAIYSGF